jgi:hypothetical protein
MYHGTALWSTEDRRRKARRETTNWGGIGGAVFDLSAKLWRKSLNSKSDLGEMLRQSYGVMLPSDISVAAEQRLSLYDGVALRWLETQQEEQRRAVLDSYKSRFITGPVLTLPVTEQFDFSFDPNGVVPVDETSSAYATLRVTDAWGVLEVSDGALIVRDQNKFVRVVVQAPKEAPGKTGEIAGNGWKLTLAQGWVLSKGSRLADFEVAKKE